MFIYALIDPRTNLIRYIGKTYKPEKRLRDHLTEARMNVCNKKSRWIRGLLSVDLKPILILIEECQGDGCTEERHHIALAKADGLHLLNLTDGGDHPQLSAESRALIAAKAKGRPVSETTRAKISAAHKGRRQSPEWIAKRTANARGRPVSADARQKMSAAKRDWKPPQSTIEAVRRAWLGKKQSPEHVRKRTDALRGQKRSPEFCARMSALNTGRKRSAEGVARQRAYWANPQVRKEHSRKQRMLSDDCALQICERYRRGDSADAIAADLGCAPNTVLRTLRRYKEPIRCPGTPRS